MSEHPSEVQFLTPEDLAKRWQISIGTISNWRTNKRGPEFIRIGGLVRYSVEAVRTWEASQPTK